MYPPAPPCGLTTVALPSLSPLQVISVNVVGSAVIGVGSVRVTVIVGNVQPLKSVTSQVYTSAAKPVGLGLSANPCDQA